jgi:hypothetical protein
MSRGVYAESGSTNSDASYAAVVFVWLYLGAFNFAGQFGAVKAVSQSD